MLAEKEAGITKTDASPYISWTDEGAGIATQNAAGTKVPGKSLVEHNFILYSKK